jgi:hypothetical protein
MNPPHSESPLGITIAVDQFKAQSRSPTSSPTEIRTTMAPYTSFILLRQELSGTSSTPGLQPPSTQSQASALIAVGVLFGVALTGLLLWCFCCRGRRGPPRDTRQGALSSRPRQNTEVRIVRSSGRRSRFAVEILTGGTSPDTHLNVDTSETEPIQATTPSNMNMDSEVRQPPRSYMYHPTPYSDLEMNIKTGQNISGGFSYTPHYSQGEETIRTPLCRRAVTSLPPPNLEAATSENTETLDGYRPPQYESASSSSSSIMEAGS